MENIVELAKNIATIIGCVTACGGFTIAIIKPIRIWFRCWIKQIVGESDTSKDVKELKNSIGLLNEKIDKMDKKVDKRDREMVEKIDKLDRRVFENEKDRIKSELSEYASRCNRGMKIFPEEWLHIQEIYSKYKDQMHLNSTGTDNYHIIEEYYTSQSWLKV